MHKNPSCNEITEIYISLPFVAMINIVNCRYDKYHTILWLVRSSRVWTVDSVDICIQLHRPQKLWAAAAYCRKIIVPRCPKASPRREKPGARQRFGSIKQHSGPGFKEYKRVLVLKRLEKHHLGLVQTASTSVCELPKLAVFPSGRKLFRNLNLFVSLIAWSLAAGIPFVYISSGNVE